MLILPSYHDTDSSFTYSCDLEDVTAQISLAWNIRSSAFFLAVQDSLGGSIYGVKVVPLQPLLYQHRSRSFMSGDLIVLPTLDYPEMDITYENFDLQWKLCYMTRAEIDQWRTDYGLR